MFGDDLYIYECISIYINKEVYKQHKSTNINVIFNTPVQKELNIWRLFQFCERYNEDRLTAEHVSSEKCVCHYFSMTIKAS